jgi:hypothetical protein
MRLQNTGDGFRFPDSVLVANQTSTADRWAPDGWILATGQGGTAPAQTSHVAKVDPNTLSGMTAVEGRADSRDRRGMRVLVLLRGVMPKAHRPPRH